MIRYKGLFNVNILFAASCKVEESNPMPLHSTLQHDGAVASGSGLHNVDISSIQRPSASIDGQNAPIIQPPVENVATENRIAARTQPLVGNGPNGDQNAPGSEPSVENGPNECQNGSTTQAAVDQREGPNVSTTYSQISTGTISFSSRSSASALAASITSDHAAVLEPINEAEEIVLGNEDVAIDVNRIDAAQCDGSSDAPELSDTLMLAFDDISV